LENTAISAATIDAWLFPAAGTVFGKTQIINATAAKSTKDFTLEHIIIPPS
jgi:hypothetical protein